MTESQIEHYLKHRVESLGGVCRKWTSPGHVGVPDRICFFPRGLIVFVEVKTHAGKLSLRQEREIAVLRGHGAQVHVVYGYEGVDCFIREMTYALSR